MTKEQKIINSKRKSSLFYKAILQIQIKTLFNNNISKNLVITGVTMGKNSTHLIVHYCSVKKGNFLQRDLDNAIPVFRREMASIIKSRRIPKLIFKQDKSLDTGSKIDRILSSKTFLNKL